MILLFRGYGSYIGWVWYFYLGGMVVLFGGMVLLFGGYGSFIWWVWYFYFGGMVLLFGGFGSFVRGV